jgi:hypothetical protein
MSIRRKIRILKRGDSVTQATLAMTTGEQISSTKTLSNIENNNLFSNLLSQQVNISTPIPNTDNVYLVREDDSDRYKIGSSGNPLIRIKTLSTGNSHELTLIACCPGDVRVEKDFQNKYFANRIRGEWFKFNELEILVVTGEYAALRLAYEKSISKSPSLQNVRVNPTLQQEKKNVRSIHSKTIIKSQVSRNNFVRKCHSNIIKDCRLLDSLFFDDVFVTGNYPIEISDIIVKDKIPYFTVADLYQVYLQWYKKTNNGIRWSDDQFSKELKKNNEVTYIGNTTRNRIRGTFYKFKNYDKVFVIPLTKDAEHYNNSIVIEGNPISLREWLESNK